MPSANGVGAVKIEKILDEELADKCGLYARVTIPAGSVLGYHEHHGNGESYFVLSGEAVYDDNGAKRTIRPAASTGRTWTKKAPSGVSDRSASMASATGSPTVSTLASPILRPFR